MSTIQETYYFFYLKKLLPLKNITYKRETISYDIKINYAKKSIGQKFMDYLGPKALNLLNLNDQKSLRTNLIKM